MIEYTVKVDNKANKFWYLNGYRHREDGPAVEHADGTNYWYLNGELHREDGPAIERPNGDKFWYLNGERHREDGPAIEYASGYKAWYLNGMILTEEGHRNQTSKKSSCEGKIVEIDGIKYELKEV